MVAPATGYEGHCKARTEARQDNTNQGVRADRLLGTTLLAAGCRGNQVTQLQSFSTVIGGREIFFKMNRKISSFLRFLMSE